MTGSPHTMVPARRPTSRTLTVILEGQFADHERLELSVTPGMTVEDLRLDEPYSRLVQPGGYVLAGTDDLFEIAADTPRIFALREATPRVRQPAGSPRHVAPLSRLLGRGGRAPAAVIALPKPRHSVAR